jgi:histone-lysine N-methyltransferase SETD2
MSSTTGDIDVKPSSSMNAEEVPSPSQSPTLVSDVSAQICKASRTPTPTESPFPEDGSSSKSSTPPFATLAKTPRKAVAAPLQLIGDLPTARKEALASFSEIQANNYQNKSLGRSRELLESMTCECAYEPGSSSFFIYPDFLVVSGDIVALPRKFPS